jgi:transcription elongation factor GreA
MIPTKKPSVKITYLTEKGLARLQTELGYLINIKRGEIAQRLREACDNEEPSENGEYILAKNEQAWVEGRICELKHLLANVEIIKPGSAKGEVALGSTVTIQEHGLPSETFTIVGTVEANTREAYISDESPIGRALLGHRVGEDVEIKAPGGNYKVRIISAT